MSTLRLLIMSCLTVFSYAASFVFHPLDALRALEPAYPWSDPLFFTTAAAVFMVAAIVTAGLILQNRMFNVQNQPGQPWRRHADGIDPPHLIE